MSTTHASSNQTTSNKALVTRFHETLSSGNPDILAETVARFIAPDFVLHTPLPINTTGADALKEVFTQLYRAFPDLHVTIEEMIAEDDKVVCRNTVTGTNRGEYMGHPPTGNAVRYSEVFIFRLANGRITEARGVVDVLTQLRQLGLLPPVVP